jgi:ComF family protein
MDRITPLVFPDDCRVCGDPLLKFYRVPVCASCLADPQPLVADFHCAACKTPFVNPFPLDENGLCALCRLGAKNFDAVYTYGSYEGTLRELLHLYKYNGMRPLSRTFGEMLKRSLPREQTFDMIVPMPLHWTKLWSRGFNQAELLAREVGNTWNVPVRDIVRRRKATAVQAGLTNSKRRLNVQGAFRIQRGKTLSGMHVLLVDDVLTTGATASACARVLKRAGAARVTVLALARTDRRLDVDKTTKSAATGFDSEIAETHLKTRGTHA